VTKKAIFAFLPGQEKEEKMASIYKRGNIWYLSAYVNGRRVRKRVARSKKLSELARQEIEVKIAKGDLGWEELEDPSFDDVKEKYLQYVEGNTRPTTFVRYKETLQHFTDFLRSNGSGSPRVSHISFETIENYKQERIKTLRPSTVNVELKALRIFYNFVIKCQCARENPANKVTFYREAEKKPTFLKKEEIDHLLKNSNGLYPILYTFLKTGLRKSELINLRWDDLDFQRKCATVESKKSWHTKTGKSRQIPLDDDLLNVLRKLPRTSEYIFLNTNGRKYDYHLNERVKKLEECIGIRNLTLHTLRHTFISHLVMSGVDLVTVKELAGHSDIKTTMRYAHLAPEHLRKSIGKLPY